MRGSTASAILLHLPTALSFSAQPAFHPSGGMCPDLKNGPSVLPAAAPALGRVGIVTTSPASPGHARPPVGGAGGGQDRVPRLSPSCEGSKPHATGTRADTSPLRQMWRPSCARVQLVRGRPSPPAPARPAARPSWASSPEGAPAHAGTGGREGGRAWQWGPKSSTERAEQQTTTPLPHHRTSS